MTGMLTKIAADEDAEAWTPVAAMNMKTVSTPAQKSDSSAD
jgi:hypothetical protein